MRRISTLLVAGVGSVLIGPAAFGPGAVVGAASPLKVGGEILVNSNGEVATRS